MKLLSSIKVRLFLTCWIVFAIHFATNIVREHYPAFSLIEDQTLKVDRYLGFHPDIFEHDDGHAYVGNNVAGSYVAAVPLLVFHPIMRKLEQYEQARIAREGVGTIEYRNEAHPNSQVFYRIAKEAGVTLRFGASAAVTSVFLIAPLSALMVVLMFTIITDRGVGWKAALGLSLLFAFGTPVFFRSGVLNHNMMLMCTTFVAFHLLWARPGGHPQLSLKRRLFAGCLCGFGLALDYSGAIPLLALYGYLVISRAHSGSWTTSIKESIPFVLASVPPVLFLLYTQWAMFGNPFLPGQYWMPDTSVAPSGGGFTNPYSLEGFRGFTIPSADLFFLNLFAPSYGMFVYGPLLIIGLIPTFGYSLGKLILPNRERVFAILFFLAFLVFCAANQYSRIQFNSGFRYLIPVVPLLYLAATDHLVRIPRRWLWVLLIPVLLNSWVISMVREPIPESWGRVLSEGLQLPWLTVLGATSSEGSWIGSALIPIAIVGFTALMVFLVWRIGWTKPSEPHAA